ncbi:MAG: 3-phosphoshikimate 1-carboxyvinyltransferase [Thermoflexus sp.]|uniref:3-phosphoshikimate 1-carboxyvinyltransferase n=1 Tax=Thermoflexus sp. TaxID=1969742 RepID=UPI0025ECAFE1|nr:3-phosphoshikimate 1-carboxyvinyltransferase [Thermoflexus sp.]MCS6964445.1 3-phosphoshikimate 1-carboxyvinyltransferase [Thermoflexus sp.]MCS7351606.1 3-phosphoshikimate 1-carboxyvinyltransferase [Thermoflexus sp.]MDW8181064.1 3-phosphoshikimate 1-carboxyvinyltransferase [Anaerolineae bacterium]MDW8184090.1 3-phosphoshikimate 1-carboxyvinyltransferase [Anaerolineae bacterium]
MRLRIQPASRLSGAISVPGDKSISHRTLLLAALADGISNLQGWLPAADCEATLRCVRALGVQVERPARDHLVVHGSGLKGLQPASEPLDCGGSGTTMRLLMGILAGFPFPSMLVGNPQLSRRPMERVAQPLRRMGAEVFTTEGHAPVRVRGGSLRGIQYELPVASAQVKSAILLAGLYADRPTTVIEPVPSRDHTERLLGAMGATVQREGNSITIEPAEQLRSLSLTIPGDPSSAAFLVAAALLIPGAQVQIPGVLLNPTRLGWVEAWQAMGAPIQVISEAEVGGEPVGLLTTAAAARLQAIEIAGAIVPRMIDEFPIFAVVATQAEGVTQVRDAAELRVKESDRIAALAMELRRMGAQIEEHPDGFTVYGPTPLRGAVVHSHEDHRLAMALAIAGLIAQGETIVEDAACIADSFPGFVEAMQALGAEIEPVS